MSDSPEDLPPRKRLFWDLPGETADGPPSDGLRFRRRPPRPAAERSAEWRRLERSIRGERFSIGRPGWSPLRLAAAVALLLVGAGLGWYLVPVTHTTGYGQIRHLTLPDGSQVTLNAHSRLRTARYWHAGRTRAVWLEGEAYFAVARQTAPPEAGTAAVPVKFVVHAAQTDVEVLGTRFNVQQRAGVTRVVLRSGRVQLRRPGLANLQMVPGELAELRGDGWVHRAVDPRPHTAWTERKLVLDQRTLGEIARTIEDFYGYPVVFSDPTLRNLRLGGTLNADQLDQLLEALEVTARVRIVREDDRLVFHPQE